ncbi:MAG: hypothetical protein KF734_01155 [Saprospiraceae bacterium]|nr:hypothetical protein [Saprospiraceae bacterium]
MKKMLSPPAKANTLLLMLVALWLLACYKDAPPPYVKPDPCPWPEVTTEGKHTLGFKINGREWVPCVDIYASVATLRPIDASLTESNGSNALSFAGVYSMTSLDSTSNSYGIAFWPLRIGKIPAEELEHTFFTFSERYGSQFIDRWELPVSRAGFQLEILRLDTDKNIISGTFEAILLPKYGTDTLYITDGRFDLTYYQQ